MPIPVAGRTTQTGLTLMDGAGRPLTIQELSDIVMKKAAQSTLYAARSNKDIEADFQAIKQNIETAIVQAMAKAAIQEVFTEFAKNGVAQADIYSQKMGNAFRMAQAQGRLGGGTRLFGEFLEEGIFGLGTSKVPSEVGDVLFPNLQGPGNELELKALINMTGTDNMMEHMVKVGGITFKGVTPRDIESSVGGMSARDILVAYKMVMKMQNLFVMEFNMDWKNYGKLSPSKATLFWELIVENLIKIITEKKDGIFKLNWKTYAEPDSKGFFASVVEIKINLGALYDMQKITQLYLRTHVFFDTGKLDGVSAREFFGTIRHMAGLPTIS